MRSGRARLGGGVMETFESGAGPALRRASSLIIRSGPNCANAQDRNHVNFVYSLV